MDVEMEILQVKKNYHQNFECPVCKEFMSAPILLCTKGHSICFPCREKVRICPLCQAKFTSGRNFSLELLAENATFPCENSNYGCHETVFLNTMNDHHKVCAYGLKECVISNKCKWKGRITDILAHVEVEHKGSILTKKKKAKIEQKKFSFDKEWKHCKIITAHGEIFLFQSFLDSAKKEYYISVHYIGSKPTCGDYFYEIHCIPDPSVSSKHEILFTTRIHAETVNIKDLIKDNISCFCLKQDMAEFFTVMGTLRYKIEIIKNS